MILPSWLFHENGSSVLIGRADVFESMVAEGWRESPAEFKEAKESGEANTQRAQPKGKARK